MAGSVMTFTESRVGPVKKIKAAWTSDDTTGAVSGTTEHYYSGKIELLVTDPGATAPTDDYDLTVADSDGIDVLAGAGANRDTANTETVQGTSLGVVANNKLTFAIAAAGNSKIGTVYVYIR